MNDKLSYLSINVVKNGYTVRCQHDNVAYRIDDFYVFTTLEDLYEWISFHLESPKDIK